MGAIVGGGILALAGTAFAATGPSAVLAFAFNGVIAFLTALSFAEVSTKFPYSGGTYAFAKRVLTVESAFAVGWVVWFASIVAGALYGLGFGMFAQAAILELWAEAPKWMAGRWAAVGLAIGATAFYTIHLSLRSASGGSWINIGKLLVFSILIAAGIWAIPNRPAEELGSALRPFFAEGAVGLISAMGFTFIALQGFDLIAAVAGEIKEPERNIPKAMFGSLGIALAVYLPLLLVVSLVGFDASTNVTAASRANPETVLAEAAQHYLGTFGYWLVVVAAILSMLSALNANLFAASRVAQSMALDRTLPDAFARVRGEARIPVTAILVTAAIAGVVQVAVPDLSAAGAASSLIFLITFALVHGIAVLVRRRSRRRPPPFRTPWFPAVPLLGGGACLALAIYQGIAVPSAGAIVAVWLCAGGLLFLGWFARGARLADVSSAARDPELMILRGLSPLVLVPIANPRHAAALVSVAQALAPVEVGRILLLSVVVVPRGWTREDDPQPLANAQKVLGESISAAAQKGLFPEALTTIGPDPWSEIARVARSHRCESLLLGLSDLEKDNSGAPIGKLLSRIDTDAVILRAPSGWDPAEAKRILVPMAGHGHHDRLLVRMLSSLSRASSPTITVMKVLPEEISDARLAVAERGLKSRARDLRVGGPTETRAVAHADAVQAVAEEAEKHDLVIMGTERSGRNRAFGSFTLAVARKTEVPLLLISHA